MKRFITSVSSIFAAGLMATAVPGQAGDMSRDETEIRALIQGTTDSYARHDAAGAMAAYRQDEKFHIFDVMLPVEQHGYKNSLKVTQDAMDGAKGPITMTYMNPTVVVDGDHAYSYALVHMIADMKNGSKTDMLVRNTDIWQRIDGKWRIIHEHNSLPLDPAAAAKLVNAKPAE